MNTPALPPSPGLPAAPQDYSHIIETGKDGRLEPVTPEDHVAALLKRAMDSNRTVVIHLHGGLVSKGSAYEMVNRLQPAYLSQKLFPIFIVWHTGLMETLANAGELVHRPIFEKLLIRLLKHFVSRYGSETGKALGPGEEPDDEEVERELQKRDRGEIPYDWVHPRPSQEDISRSEEDDLVKAIEDDGELKEEWALEVKAPEVPPGGKSLGLDESIRDEALEEAERPGGKALLSGAVLARHAVLIAARVIKRYYKHRDHGLHTTIVEEILRELYVDLIGTEIWQFMKQDSADTFQPDTPPHERGGWLLMKLLGNALKERQAAGKALPKVSVLGHSAGSIYAAHLLGYLDTERKLNGSAWFGSRFKFDKLVFLAPAATCKTLSTMLTLHAAAPLFGAFRMYSLTDDTEHGYYEVPVLYPGSLLYIISGLLESEDDGGSGDMPLVGMQRYERTKYPFTQAEVTQVWQFLKAAPAQLVWSGEHRGPGLNCDSRQHGEFFRTPETIESFLYFLNA